MVCRPDWKQNQDMVEDLCHSSKGVHEKSTPCRFMVDLSQFILTKLI